MDAGQMAKFQLQMRENQEEVNDFVSGLGSWATEMKEKEAQMKKSQPKVESTGEPPIRNSLLKKRKKKVKKATSEAPSGSNSTEKKKISAYDYRAWDKFDVDAACAEVEEGDGQRKKSDEEEETDEEWEEERRELLAKQEKEKGNAHFKACRWDEAVECYTTSLRLDPCNPLLFTNRAMAQIKAGRFAAAEADCSEALLLDPASSKALFRRGVARKSLGPHRAKDALEDFEALLRLEPQNKAALAEVKALEKIVRPTGEVKPVQKNPSQRSQKPLRRIPIEQIGDQSDREKPKPAPELANFLRARDEEGDKQKNDGENKETIVIPSKKEESSVIPSKKEESSVIPSKREESSDIPSKKEESSDIPSKKEETIVIPSKREEASVIPSKREEDLALEEPLPRSFTQFARSFSALKFRSESLLLTFLRRIPAASYPTLFGQCLEPAHLNAMVRALADADADSVQSVAGLRALRLTPRFNFLAMMVGAKEKTALRDLKQRLISTGQLSEAEANQLLSDFRL